MNLEKQKIEVTEEMEQEFDKWLNIMYTEWIGIVQMDEEPKEKIPYKKIEKTPDPIFYHPV